MSSKCIHLTEIAEVRENTPVALDAINLALMSNALGEAIIVVNERSQITYLNAAAASMLGSNLDELQGQLFKNAVSIYQIDEINEAVISRGVTLYHQKNVIVTRNGAHIPILLTVAPIWVAERITSLVYSFHDNSQQIQSEQSHLALARRQESLAGLAQRLMLCNPLPFMMNDALSTLTRTLQMPFAGVFIHRQDALQFVYGKGWVKEMNTEGATIQQYSRKNYSLLSDKPCIIENLDTDTHFPKLPFLMEHKVTSGISTIIHGIKRPFGILTVFSEQKRCFTDDDIAYIVTVAKLISTAVNQKRIEEKAAIAVKKAHDKHHRIQSFAVHDLEAPLRKMMTFSEYIMLDAKETLSQDSLNHLERIRQSAEQMQRLIKDWVRLSTE